MPTDQDAVGRVLLRIAQIEGCFWNDHLASPDIGARRGANHGLLLEHADDQPASAFDGERAQLATTQELLVHFVADDADTPAGDEIRVVEKATPDNPEPIQLCR